MNPEDFFVPYVWGMVYAYSKPYIPWSTSAITLFSSEDYDNSHSNKIYSGMRLKFYTWTGRLSKFTMTTYTTCALRKQEVKAAQVKSSLAVL